MFVSSALYSSAKPKEDDPAFAAAAAAAKAEKEEEDEEYDPSCDDGSCDVIFQAEKSNSFDVLKGSYALSLASVVCAVSAHLAGVLPGGVPPVVSVFFFPFPSPPSFSHTFAHVRFISFHRIKRHQKR